ncbi:hypothetical protein bcgnr5372_25420 [Bacillus luti]|nr:hypothetical protein [Bacillus cereus]HDR8328616.1 hypothetical protein [Bacillus cereus]HDR8334252.1 hypothetical protein [Bacillus cereus]
MKKLMWVLGLFICFMSFSDQTYAYTFNKDDYAKARHCYLNEEIDKRTRTDAAFEQYLNSLGLPVWMTANNYQTGEQGWYKANREVARNHCILSYGDADDVQYITATRNGYDKGQVRYFGIIRVSDWQVAAVPNEKYPDECDNSCGNFLRDTNFLWEPYDKNSAGYKGIVEQRKWGTIPLPGPKFSAAIASDFYQFTMYPIDPFKGTDSDPNGQFDVNNKTFNWSNNFLDTDWGGGPRLLAFAGAIVPAKEYAYGYFNMYHKDGVYWYRTFFIPPGGCFVACKQGDVSVKADLDKKELKSGEKLTGYIDIFNGHFGNIYAPCADGGNGDPKCHDGNRTKAYLKIYDRNSWQEVKNFEFKYNGIPLDNGKQRDIEVGNFGITLPKGDYRMYVDIPYYKDEINNTSNPFENNTTFVDFKVKNEENASVKINGKTEYSSDQPLEFKFPVSNNMDNPISGNLNIQIKEKDENGEKLVWSKDVYFNNIAKKDTWTFDMKSLGVKLPAGFYNVYASIPNYNGETTYEDNKANSSFKVKMFIPQHVRCKALDVKYTKVVGVSGGPNLVKSCVGQTPEFPSTTIEGGQTTYFYVGYRLFPMPVPAYKVENLDKKGLDQKLTLKEPFDTKASCNLQLTSDSNCRLDDTFIHFPSKSGESTIPAPYTTGDYGEYHYKYRGRLFPETVRFQFNIFDPSGNKVTSSGSLVYRVDPSCYDTKVLDMKESCRNIDFYIPKVASDAKGDESKPYVVPYDKGSTSLPDNGVKFTNPGLHTFDLKVAEEQVYRYQKDNGYSTPAEYVFVTGDYNEVNLWYSTTLAEVRSMFPYNSVTSNEVLPGWYNIKVYGFNTQEAASAAYDKFRSVHSGWNAWTEQKSAGYYNFRWSDVNHYGRINSGIKVDKYRIVTGDYNSVAWRDSVINKIKETLPTVDVWYEEVAPGYYRIFVGDYADKSQADSGYNKIKSIYPSYGLWVDKV